MSLKKYHGKKVKIIDDAGMIFEGVVNDYIFPEDNSNNKESIIVDTFAEGPVEFQSSDIRAITIV